MFSAPIDLEDLHHGCVAESSLLRLPGVRTFSARPHPPLLRHGGRGVVTLSASGSPSASAQSSSRRVVRHLGVRTFSARPHPSLLRHGGRGAVIPSAPSRCSASRRGCGAPLPPLASARRAGGSGPSSPGAPLPPLASARRAGGSGPFGAIAVFGISAWCGAPLPPLASARCGRLSASSARRGVGASSFGLLFAATSPTSPRRPLFPRNRGRNQARRRPLVIPEPSLRRRLRGSTSCCDFSGLGSIFEPSRPDTRNQVAGVGAA
jgi:hypothetical protein